MIKRIAITGASGFIGGQAIKRLAGLGYETIRLGRDELQEPEVSLKGAWGVLHCAGKAGAWEPTKDALAEWRSPIQAE